MDFPTNYDRARWAGVAVLCFRMETKTDQGDAVADLLADLMHFCDRTPGAGDFHAALDQGLKHYAAELADELNELPSEAERIAFTVYGPEEKTWISTELLHEAKEAIVYAVEMSAEHLEELERHSNAPEDEIDSARARHNEMVTAHAELFPTSAHYVPMTRHPATTDDAQAESDV